MPAAERLLAEHGIDASDVPATGPGGRLLKEDVQAYLDKGRAGAKGQSTAKPESAVRPAAESKAPSPAPSRPESDREEEVVRMTPLRRKAAEALVNAQQSMALLTTFNECDMSAVMQMREAYKADYEKQHGIKLGFMSFFVKAVVEALKQFPAVNAEISGENIVYKNYYDVGIAVSGKKGLVVPVLRNAERMSFGEIELAISDMGKRAREGKVTPEELQGGTFTITNGGIFGSMMSTPIVNPPQSAILGMHAIKERPAVIEGEVVVRPMMYLALTYDHRIIDGREAVSFLVRVKECIEDPARILLEI
jgi:2-oxoglutarate dehydrogenase E2 component (dihydrolipoamide succinyltransferase)